MKKLTVSIVNYNAGDYLLKCLQSLKKNSKELDFDVFVIDNASLDGSFEKAEKEYKEFNFIKNKENLGFGKAHNQVLRKSKTPYVLTLNPDCEVPPGTLKYMFEFMEKDSSVGLSTCRVEKSDGTPDKAAHRGFPTPYASFKYLFLKNDKLYHLTDRDMTKPHEIDSAVGAFMFIRKSALDKVGYFDEDYFLYGEDIDLCYRIKEGGFKVMYVPEVKVLHVKGVSSGIKKHSASSTAATDNTKSLAVGHFYDTMDIFYDKHYKNKYPFFVGWGVKAGVLFKKQMAKRTKSV